MRRRLRHLPVWLAALFAVSAAMPVSAAEQDPPSVVVSIPPLHSLVARVMDGIGDPALLIPAAASPHSFTLKPSDARTLAGADIVFWIGPTLETALTGPLAALADEAERIALIDAPGIERLPVREGGVWGEHRHHDHGNGDRDAHGHDADGAGHREEAHDQGEVDAHIWLDTGNAQAIVRTVSATLAQRDPTRAALYDRNRDAALTELRALAARLDTTLAPIRTQPFLVLHDGYQYFEHEFGLAAAGAVAISPDIRAGARRIATLRDTLRARNIGCLFGEPQAANAAIRTIAEGSGARIGWLDPLGLQLEPGPGLYPQMMTGLAAGIAGCLTLGG